MSQKSSTFALVIELERHIEILLLSNDCVIVPGLGGFVAHHCEARFDDEDNMFLPPLRTLGFNPQLNMNDSLLAQSYIEAYDISYPEAVHRIETEIAELKQRLSIEGSYEFNDIGILSVNEEGKLEFEPCEAGLLTPMYYGLSSFEMAPLHGAAKKTQHLLNTDTPVEEKEDEKEEVVAAAEKEADSNEEAITIRMSWVRNTVAVAAALLAFFIMTPHIDNSKQPEVNKSQMSLPIIMKNATPVKPVELPNLQDTISKRDTAATTIAPVSPIKEKEAKPAADSPAAASATATHKAQPSGNYCIVVASQVSQHNAEAFVKKLQQEEGLEDARVHVYNNIRRVICGSYSTEAEAYQQMQNLVHQHSKLRDAWVYKLTN